MKRALITGVAGFTGEYLAQALSDSGCEVFGTTVTATAGKAAGRGPANCTLVPMDLTDAASVHEAVARVKPDWVVHLAALSFVAHPNPGDFYQVNTLGTDNLLKALAALAEPPSRVILASTANVYGALDEPVLDESFCPAPVNHYGCSKLAMEHIAANWFTKLPILITRPFNYTGPGQPGHFLVPKMVSHFARREKMIELGNIHVSRDISDVRDVVDAYCRLLRSDAHSQCVNLCSGEATELSALLETLGELAGYQIDVQVNPDFVRKAEIPVLRGNAGRLESITGPRTLIPLRQTLADMLAHYARG
jgi:nucleoside-diphosphate-sugar epimerase